MRFEYEETVDMIVAIVAAYSILPEHSIEAIGKYSNAITALKYQDSYTADQILALIDDFRQAIKHDSSFADYSRVALAYESLEGSKVYE